MVVYNNENKLPGLYDLTKLSLVISSAPSLTGLQHFQSTWLQQSLTWVWIYFVVLCDDIQQIFKIFQNKVVGWGKSKFGKVTNCSNQEFFYQNKYTLLDF